MVYFCFGTPTILSTCIRTEAIFLVVSTYTGSSCFFPLVNAGILSSALQNCTLSLTLKPVSASPRSPGKRFFKIPQFSAKYLSEVHPPQASLTKETVPSGVIPVKTFKVLWCLYLEKVCALARRFVGRSIKTSKQSMISVVLRPNESKNHLGMVLCNSSQLGHFIRGDRQTFMTLNQVERILDTTAHDIPKRYTRS